MRRGLESLEQSQLKHTMLHAGCRSYLLLDHSKVDHAPFPYWTPLDREHTMIVDDGDPEALEPFEAVRLCTLLVAHD